MQLPPKPKGRSEEIEIKGVAELRARGDGRQYAYERCAQWASSSSSICLLFA